MEKYFYGNKISDYGVENGRVDYATFSKAFDAVLCDDIFKVCDQLNDYSVYDNMRNDVSYEFEHPITGELLSFDGFTDFECWVCDIEEEYNITIDEDLQEIDADVYQWYLVPDTPMNRALFEEAHQVYTYCESLDVLVWGVTHYGTSWDYVLTSIEI